MDDSEVEVVDMVKTLFDPEEPEIVEASDRTPEERIEELNVSTISFFIIV